MSGVVGSPWAWSHEPAFERRAEEALHLTASRFFPTGSAIMVAFTVHNWFVAPPAWVGTALALHGAACATAILCTALLRRATPGPASVAIAYTAVFAVLAETLAVACLWTPHANVFSAGVVLLQLVFSWLAVKPIHGACVALGSVALYASLALLLNGWPAAEHAPAFVTQCASIAAAGVTTTVLAFVQFQLRARAFLAQRQLDREHARATELAEQRRALAAENEEAAREAGSAAAEKASFLADVSARVRAPMSAIRASSRLALDDALDATTRRRLERILHAVDGLERLLADALDPAAVESRRVSLVAEPFSLARVWEDASALLEVRAQEKGLSLEFVLDERVPPRLVGDAGRILQVLMNLCTNALKFTSRGGVRVVVTTTGPLARERVTLLVSVIDTGIGLSSQQQARLFEEFAQADATVSRQFGGTGLGLSISRRIAEAMGGRLWVESALGQGSTFRLEVPLGVAADGAVSSVPAPAEAVSAPPPRPAGSSTP